MKTVFTLEEVQSAFRRLEDYAAARNVDATCMWAIHEAAADGIRILTGEWEPEKDAPQGDALRGAVLEARSAAAFDAAAAAVLAWVLEPARVAALRGKIDDGWEPSPAGNRAMLKALEVYAEKVAGAVGRGAGSEEARQFAFVEARRVYQGER